MRRTRWFRHVAAGTAAAIALSLVGSAAVARAETGEDEFVWDLEGNYDHLGAVTSTGRFFALTSWDGISPTDTNGLLDVYVKDRESGDVSRVSVASDGSQIEGWLDSWGDPFSVQTWAEDVQLDADGSSLYVLFSSQATNLVDGNGDGSIEQDHGNKTPDDTNGADRDVYVAKVSVADLSDLDGIARPVVSRIGLKADHTQPQSCYSSGTAKLGLDQGTGNVLAVMGCRGVDSASVSNEQVYLMTASRADLTHISTTLVSKGIQGRTPNGWSGKPDIADNGSTVVFQSTASNLVLNDRNPNTADIFVWDRSKGKVTLVGLTPDGRQPGPGHWAADPHVSPDGQYVTYYHQYENYPGYYFTQLYVRSLQSNKTVDPNPAYCNTAAYPGLAGYGDSISVVDGTVRVVYSVSGQAVDLDGDGSCSEDPDGSSAGEVLVTDFTADLSTKTQRILNRDANGDSFGMGIMSGWMSSDGRTLFYQTRYGVDGSLGLFTRTI